MKQIQGFSNYCIDKKGKVLNVKTGKTLKHGLSCGYPKVYLYKDGKMRGLHVHRLLMKTYSPICGMDELQVDHIDGDRSNFCLSNLRWVTPSENVKFSHERVRNRSNQKLTPDIVLFCRRAHVLRSKKYSATALAKRFGVSRETLRQAILGNSWKHVKENK